METVKQEHLYRAVNRKDYGTQNFREKQREEKEKKIVLLEFKR